MSQVGKRPADEKVNGGVSSPSKIAKMEDNPENLSHDERLARMKDFFSKGGPKPPPPKPKPKKAPPVTNADNTDGPTSPPKSPLSPGVEDPGRIVLNMESLSQLSTIMEIDLDAVVRQQDILENQAQKDRAALSQSKGLQTRRLPKNFASKVPEDYAARRRAQSYSTGSLRITPSSSEDTDSPRRESTPEMTEEERKQRILARSGVSQGSSNPLAALGSILKRRNSLKGSKSPKAPKKSVSDSPRSTPKMKKRDSIDTPDSASVSKGFFGSLRRSGRKNKNKVDSSSTTASANVSTEDLRDNSSIVSMPVHSSPYRPTEEPLVTSTPVKKEEVTLVPTKLKDSVVTSPVHDGPRNSKLFREASIERLFDSDSSNLFGSSELEAFFKNEKEKTPGRTIPEEEPKPMEKATEDEVEPKKTTPQSESKSSMRHRLHAYEKASVSGSISESPPLDEGNKNKREDRGSKEKEKVKTEPKKKTGGLFDDVEEDDLFGPSKPQSPPAKSFAQSYSDKKKASLFEDELFQEDVKTKASVAKKEPPKVMPKKLRKSVEDSPKRETKKESTPVSPAKTASPVKTKAAEVPKETKKAASESVIKEEPKAKSPPPKPAKVKSPPPEPKPKEEPKKEKEQREKAKSPASEPSKPEPKEKSPPPEPKPKEETKKAGEREKKTASSFFDDGSALPVYGLRRKPRGTQAAESEKKEPVKVEEKPVETKTSGGLFDDEESDLPPFGLRRNRRRADKDETDAKPKGLFDDNDGDVPPHYGRRMQAGRQKEGDSLFDDIDKELEPSKKEEPKSDDKTQIEKESEEREKEKKVSKETPSSSLFDDQTLKEEAPSKSPEVAIKEPTPEKEEVKEPEAPTESKEKTEVKRPSSGRDRSATELGTSSTRGGRAAASKKAEPSWTADLKKKKDSDDKTATTAAGKKTTTKSSTAAKDEDIPDWQKRVIERRQKRAAAAAEANKTSSPRTSRLSAKTETTSTTKSGTKSPTAGRKSPTSPRKSPTTERKTSATGRKSPTTSRKSPVTGRKSPATERKSTVNTERKSRVSRGKDETSKTINISTSKTSTKDSKDDKPKEVESTKPKPTTRKPSVEIVTKRITISTSKSPRTSTTSPEPKPTKADTEDEVFEEGKTAEMSKVRSPSPKLSTSSVLEEPDGKKTPVEAKETTKDSTSKESNSDAKVESKDRPKSRSDSTSEGGERADTPPFRSHSISRSPTPTSPTGPLKLPTDPDVPEWKRKLLERKKSTGSSSPATKRTSTTTSATKKAEPELPAWKKELLAKRQGASSTSTERKPRSATVSVTTTSTTRAGRRGKVQETPDFMKEFKSKQKSKD